MSKKNQTQEINSPLLAVSLLTRESHSEVSIKNDIAKEKHFSEIKKEFLEKNKNVEAIQREGLWEKVDQSQKDSFLSLKGYYHGLLNERSDLQKQGLKDSSQNNESENDEVAVRYTPPSF